VGGAGMEGGTERRAPKLKQTFLRVRASAIKLCPAKRIGWRLHNTLE